MQFFRANAMQHAAFHTRAKIAPCGHTNFPMRCNKIGVKIVAEL